MKVLFINTVYKRGSTGRIVADLGHMLEEKGHEFRVAYGRGDHRDDPHCYRVGNDLDMYIHAGLSRITDRAGFYSKHATKKLIKFIRDYNPDIIHLHNLHGYYVNIEILFNYLADKYKGKVIWTLHDCWAFTGHCVHYIYAQCDKWKHGCSKCPEKDRYPRSIAFDNSSKNYKTKKKLFSDLNNLTLVTPSRWLQSEAKKSFLKKHVIRVINNGIDLKVFNPGNDHQKDKCLLLNVADGLDERKGIDDLKKLSTMLPNGYKIYIIGAADDGQSDNSKMIYVKRTANVQELVSYYRKASVFLNPTYEDNFPTVNMEALACGTPIITYNSGGSPEVVSEDCGAVLKPGDIEEMRNCILNNSFDTQKCSSQGAKFDKTIKYREYIELYKKLAN